MRRTIATAFASLLTAGAAGVALAPSGAAAQEGTTILLVPAERGDATPGGAPPQGQEYVLMLMPRTAGQPGGGLMTPERGGVGPGGASPQGQEYVLILTPRTPPTAGPSGHGFGQEAQQEGRTGPMMMPMQPGHHGMMMGQGPHGPATEHHDLERFGREVFERGYQLGRLQEGQAQQQGSQQVLSALEDAERALQQGDRQAAEEAIRRAKQQAAGGQQQAQGRQQTRQQQSAQAEQGQAGGQQQQAQQIGQQQQGAMGAATVTVEQSQQHGPYLTDASGRALYLFTTDTQGTGGTDAQSTCYEACAEAWPPLLTQGDPEATGQADASLLGTIERRDGATQVTYNGWPLYYYVQDRGPGEATGQDVHGFGGEWYLLTPEGEKAGEES